MFVVTRIKHGTKRKVSLILNALLRTTCLRITWETCEKSCSFLGSMPDLLSLSPGEWNSEPVFTAHSHRCFLSVDNFHHHSRKGSSSVCVITQDHWANQSKPVGLVNMWKRSWPFSVVSLHFGRLSYTW